MPISWSSVTSKPEFQSLSAQEKDAARNEYFDTVVAPKVPETDLESARAEFDADTAIEPSIATLPEIPGVSTQAVESPFGDVKAFEERPTYVPPEPEYESPSFAEEPGWGEAIAGHAEAGALRIPAQIGGVRRAIGERAIKDIVPDPELRQAITGEIKLTPEEVAELPKPEGMLLPPADVMQKAITDKRARKLEEFKAEVPEIKAGTEMYKKYMDLATEARPKDIDPDSAKRYVGEATEALIGNVLPTIVVGIATRSPNIALPFMGTQVYGEKYAEQRDKGRTEEQANVDALFYSASEAIPERIPLGIALKSGGAALGKILKTAGAEGLQEMFTEVLQIGYDTGVLDEKTDLKTAARQVVDAGIVGSLVGTSMAATTTGAEAVIGRIRKEPAAEEVPPTAEAIPPVVEPVTEPVAEPMAPAPTEAPAISQRVSELLATIPLVVQAKM